MPDGLEILEDKQPIQEPRKAVQKPKEEEAAPAIETHIDVWDSTGRLISNDRNNPV